MGMKVRAILIAAVLLMTAWLSGCGHYTCGATFGNSSCTSSGSGLSQGGSTTTNAFVYAVDTLGTLDGYTLTTGGSSGGSFGPNGLTGPTIPKNDVGGGMLVVKNQYLYVTFPITQQIYGYTISSGGQLTALSGFPLTLTFLAGVGNSGNGRLSVVANPAGTFMFFADALSDQIYVYSIGSSGGLTPVSGSPFSAGASLGGMTIDGLGKYLYAIENGDSIGAFTIGSTGALTAVAGSPFVYPMAQIVGEPSGKYLIGTTGTNVGSGQDNDQLYTFSITQSGSSAGAISLTSTTVTQFSPFSIAVQSQTNGNLLYSFSINDTDTGFNGIEGYSITASTGALAMDSGSPFTDVTLGSWGQFDPSGAFVFDYSEVVNSDGSITVTLGALQVGTGGALTQPTSSTTLVTPGMWTVTDVP